MVQIIENWRATRSGAFMTIVGELDGKPVRLPGIVATECGAPYPVAIDRNGNRHHLDAPLAKVAAAA
jgi:hypothetical protein